MSVNDSWMPLYLGDYLADTMHLNASQHGAYLLLLMHYWRNGPLPSDDAQLAAIARCNARLWKTVGPVVRAFFRPNGTLLHQKRMDQEREKAGAKFQARSTAGAAGANGKWKRNPETAQQHTLTRSQRLAEARKLGSHTDAEWSNMLEICDWRCVRCGTKTEGPPCKDHIRPIYRGGSDGIENIQPLCRECNSKKGPDVTDHRPRGWRDKMPETPGKTPGKMPNGPLTKGQANACRDDCQTPGEVQSQSESSFFLSDLVPPQARELAPSVAEIRTARRADHATLTNGEAGSEVVATLGRALGRIAYAPGRGPRLTIQEQIEVATPKRVIRPSHLTPEQLSIARRIVAFHA